MKRLSRMESSKEARRVLSRHCVDLSYCQYSCYGQEIRLTGSLIKTDGGDFNGPQVQAIIQEFQRKLPGAIICGELDNWRFSSDHIINLVNKGHRETYLEEEDHESEPV
jgi:hypothetical protein